MTYFKQIMCAALLGAVVAGCSVPAVLVLPDEIPEYITTYQSRILSTKTKDVTCQLNLYNTVEEAKVGERTISGKIEITQVYPIKEVVRSEFANVIAENFRSVQGNEQPKLEMKVETRKTILTRDGDRQTFDLAVAIMLLDPRHEEKPYFSKVYSQKVNDYVYDEIYVPNIVYKAIQLSIKEFLNDVSADSSLVQWIEDLTK